MNTGLFVEDSFALSPTDILRNRHQRRADIDYWVEDAVVPSLAFVTVGGKAPQVLTLQWEDITYGKRAYFMCACGLRANKLHLPQNGNEFRCRKCHRLQYQLSTLNRHSVAGVALYRLNRLKKLSDSRANMGRILYRGDFTKRFERFLGLCDKAGLNSVVAGANDLRALIKG